MLPELALDGGGARLRTGADMDDVDVIDAKVTHS